MKQMKKIASLLLALALIMGLAVSASAVDITVNNATATNKYDFYRVFDASVGAGTEVTYTVNATYQDALEQATGKTVGSEIVAYVAGLNADGMRTFADDLYEAIKTNTIAADKTVTAAGTSVTASGLETGYYLVAERVTDKSDSVSLVMLDTAGNQNITITTKEDEPTIKKYIVLEDGTEVTSTEVYEGEVLDYKVEGTISNKYANYKTYTYRIVDDLSGALDLVDGSVKVFVQNGEDSYDVTTAFTKEPVTGDGNFDFSLTAELKALDAADDRFEITGATKIVATYSATCSNRNVLQGGHYNSVKLQFENDPYDEDPVNITGETPVDRVSAYGFVLTVNKTDGADTALNGAGFTLYKWNEETSAYDLVKEINKPGDSTFVFPKVETGKYKLEETTVPAGYNKAEDIIFTIEADYDNMNLNSVTVKNEEDAVISGTEGEGKTFVLGKDGNGNINGTMSVTVKNLAGTELPETGGIGTTIFYVVGGILVLAAVVLLVTKKRMANAA